MFKLNLVVAVGFLALLTEVSGLCGDCGADSKVACLNETAFDVCFLVGTDLTKSGIIGSCKGGQVCTAEAGICKDPSATVTPDCSGGCNVCSGMFACVSKTEFSLCDTDKPTNVVMKCPEKTICDITDPVICASCASDPTCSNDEVKKPDPAVDYPDTCIGKATGFYVNIHDATCKSYVFCQEYSGEIVSILYTCPSGYFDTGKCVATKPVGCE